MADLLCPIVIGEEDGENRMIVARRIEKKVEDGK
jgi:hypothetical protein